MPKSEAIDLAVLTEFFLDKFKSGLILANRISRFVAAISVNFDNKNSLVVASTDIDIIRRGQAIASNTNFIVPVVAENGIIETPEHVGHFLFIAFVLFAFIISNQPMLTYMLLISDVI